MSEDKKELISSTFESLVDRDRVEELLPDEANGKLLSVVLHRETKPTKRPRDYALASFSGLYSGALPFMKAGLGGFSRGEVIFINELVQSLLMRGGSPERLILASQENSSISYPFGWMVESELMADLYLKTSGSDTYEGLFSDFLEWVSKNSSISEDDASLLRTALREFDSVFGVKSIEVLNPLPGYHSKTAYRRRDGTSVPDSVSSVFTQPIDILDRRPWSLDHMVPQIKDLLLRAMAGQLKSESLGLGALSPLMEILDRHGILGIVLQIEAGSLKKLSLVRKVAGEAEPPVFGPTRAMASLMISLTNSSAVLLENYNTEWMITHAREKKGFFAVLTKGAVSTPSDPQLALLGGGKSVRAGKTITPAVETFVYEPESSDVGSLDPVAIPYESLNDNFSHFKVTRLCFYSLDEKAVTPIHQGVICLGVDGENYNSACIDVDGQIAKRIIRESYSFLTGHKGQDQIASNTNEAIDLIKTKYSLDRTFQLYKDQIENDLMSYVSGKFGANSGLACEIYSLNYQASADENPVYFAASIYAAKLLSNVKTYAQRFDLKDYLHKEDDR